MVALLVLSAVPPVSVIFNIYHIYILHMLDLEFIILDTLIHPETRTLQCSLPLALFRHSTIERVRLRHTAYQPRLLSVFVSLLVPVPLETQPAVRYRALLSRISIRPMEPAFHVAIIGGGIGGLSCVLSLAHHNPCLRIDVYEQAAHYSEIGAGVGIGVNAAKILHHVGVGAEVNAISGERNNIHRTLRRWDNGEEIVTIGADYDKGEIKQLSVHRAELLEVLYKAIEKRGIAKLHASKRCVKVEVSFIYFVFSWDLSCSWYSPNPIFIYI